MLEMRLRRGRRHPNGRKADTDAKRDGVTYESRDSTANRVGSEGDVPNKDTKGASEASDRGRGGSEATGGKKAAKDSQRVVKGERRPRP